MIEFKVKRMDIDDDGYARSHNLCTIAGEYEESKRKAIEIAMDQLEVK